MHFLFVYFKQSGILLLFFSNLFTASGPALTVTLLWLRNLETDPSRVPKCCCKLLLKGREWGGCLSVNGDAPSQGNCMCCFCSVNCWHRREGLSWRSRFMIGLFIGLPALIVSFQFYPISLYHIFKDSVVCIYSTVYTLANIYIFCIWLFYERKDGFSFSFSNIQNFNF